VYALFALLIAAGVALALGYRSKLSAAVLALGWGYVELIDRATYLNHCYLVCLMALMLACAPAGRALSFLPSERCAQPARGVSAVFALALCSAAAGAAASPPTRAR
jgi:hypothetical protein